MHVNLTFIYHISAARVNHSSSSCKHQQQSSSTYSYCSSWRLIWICRDKERQSLLPECVYIPYSLDIFSLWTLLHIQKAYTSLKNERWLHNGIVYERFRNSLWGWPPEMSRDGFSLIVTTWYNCHMSNVIVYFEFVWTAAMFCMPFQYHNSHGLLNYRFGGSILLASHDFSLKQCKLISLTYLL